MEEWEREHIRKNLPELIKATKFRQSLLDKLIAEGVIGDEDTDQLKKEGPSDYTRTSELYDLLKTKVNGFQALSRSLLEDNQTGAYRLLQKRVAYQEKTVAEKLSNHTLFSCILPDIDELLDDANINILIVSTQDLRLSLRRIADVGPKYVIVLDDKTLRISKKALQDFDDETAVVIPCDNVEVILKRLEGSATNVVLITTRTSTEIEEAIGRSQENVKIVEENIRWAHLTPIGQNIILQQNVTFQNQVIRLEDIPVEILPTEDMEEQIMLDLLNGMCPEFVKNSVPSTPSYYVPRKVASRVSISPEVFQNEGKDVFVVEGIELYQLTKLTRKRNGEAVPVARSSEQRKVLTAQFIQVEHEEDYDDICKLTENPVHLMSYKSGEFTWRKSHNSLGCIQKYIRDTQENVENEDNFVQRCLASESPICIADSPGMGKTLLLTRIAEKVLSESAAQHCVVRFLVLKDLIPDVKSQTKMNVDLACEIITKSSSDFDCGRKIVTRALKSAKVKCHVFLDGYDELLSDQVSIANEMLACMIQLRSTQLYVSTRLHRCHELEEALNITGCRIQPFDEEDQVTFLTCYWNEAGAVKNDRLKEFAKSCLGTLKKGLTETERNIAGIPLQCRILAELYSKEAKQYSEGRKLELKDSYASSLFGMFQSFVDMGFGKVETTMKERVRHAHVYYAIKLLFPEIEQEFKPKFLEQNLAFAKDSILLVPGILEISLLDEHPKFTHRTLAEYMVAHFLNECLTTTIKSIEGNIVGVVLRKILATYKREDILLKTFYPFSVVSVESEVFEYPVICYFLNSFMLKNIAEAPEATREAAGSADFKSPFPTREISDIFTASVASNLPAIASFLAKLKNFYIENLSWSNLFLLAAKYAGPELFRPLTTLAKQLQVHISETNYHMSYTVWENFAVTPLHVAVHWGNYNVTILLLNNHGFHDLLVQDLHKIRLLLHTCVTGSYDDAEQVINDKSQIIKLLCSEEENTPPNPYRHVLEERLPDGSTPLLQPRVHPKLIQCLIQVGADINAVNEKKQCVLHTVLINGLGGFNPIRFHELVESLTQTAFKHYDLKSNDFGTPLKCAIDYFDSELRTVDILLEKGADINCIDGQGNSILFYLLINGRSKEYVHQLAGRGAKLTYEINGTKLVIPARVMEAFEYVIEITPSAVNTFARKKLRPPDSLEASLEYIINAKVDLQEMTNHQMPCVVLSLHNPSILNNTAEPWFIVHSRTSKIIERKWRSTENDSRGLVFNYNKLLTKNCLGEVASCSAKVVLMNQQLIDKIGKVFEEETGTYRIVGFGDIQFTDLPKQTQQLICSKKIGVRRKYNKFDAWNENFPIEKIRGKVLFDLTIENRITLINREQAFDLDDSAIFDYGISRRWSISTSIFRTRSDDVFVIQGADLQQLLTLTRGMLTDKSSNQLSLLSARCILLESKDDFDKICSISKFPVHLLNYHDEDEGCLSWVKSHGSLAVIQENIHYQQQLFRPAAFVKDIARPSHPTCLAYDRYFVELRSAIVTLKKQIYQSRRSAVFCLQFNKELANSTNASLKHINPIQFVAELLSDYALGRELVINALPAAQFTFHLIFYCQHDFFIKQNEMSAIRKIVCNTKPLRNIQLHFIVEERTLSQMEEALQTLGYIFRRRSVSDTDAEDSSYLDSSDSC